MSYIFPGILSKQNNITGYIIVLHKNAQFLTQNLYFSIK